MADSIRITTASGKSRDGITGELIPIGTPVANVAFNSRCAPFLTVDSLRKLADEIEKGEGVLFSDRPANGERWPELGWTFRNTNRKSDAVT